MGSNVRAAKQNHTNAGNVVKIDTASGMQTPIAKDATVEEFADSFSDDAKVAFQDDDPEPLLLTKNLLIELWLIVETE